MVDKALFYCSFFIPSLRFRTFMRTENHPMNKLLLFFSLIFCIPSVSVAQQADLTFGLMADIQYWDGNSSGTRYYRQSLQKLTEAVQTFNQLQPDFVVQLGDLIDRDLQSFKPVLAQINLLGMPCYHVLGNHDLSVETRENRKIAALLGMEENWYSFSRKSWRFIILDGTDISTYSPRRRNRNQAEKILATLRAEGLPQALEWNGMPGAEQMEWFSDELKAAAEKGEQVIVFSHFSVYPDDAHNFWNAAEIRELLLQHNHIKAWFSGHNHKGSYGNFNQIHFVGMRAMVETEGLNAFSLVEIYHNKLWIKGMGREKSMILAH